MATLIAPVLWVFHMYLDILTWLSYYGVRLGAFLLTASSVGGVVALGISLPLSLVNGVIQVVRGKA